MYRYGQLEAAEALQNGDMHITGLYAQTPIGHVLSSFLALMVMSGAAFTFRQRLPCSKEQMRAMTPINWGVLAQLVFLIAYADSRLLLPFMFRASGGSLQSSCQADAIVYTSSSILQLYLFFFILLESFHKIKLHGQKRLKSWRYIIRVAMLAATLFLPVMAFYRVSGTAVNDLCVYGLPLDILAPILGGVGSYCLYAAINISLPLLRNSDTRMKAWGIRTIVGTVLSVCCMIVLFAILCFTGPYITSTYSGNLTLLCQCAALNFEAYLIDYRPPYKSIVELSANDDSAKHSMRSSATDAAARNICADCCQQDKGDRTLVSSWRDTRTVTSAQAKGSHASILDSETIADFVSDLNIADRRIPRSLPTIQGDHTFQVGDDNMPAE